MTETLVAKGLTTVPTQHYTEKPLPRANVHRMLRNRYYLGKSTWGGIEYQGSHPQLIENELFERVQEVLTAHNLAGEKQRVHRHYLKGSVWCGSCGSRLVITKTTNRHGASYDYFFCVGRNQKRTACLQKAIPIELVERHVEEKWRNVRLDPDYAELLRTILEQEISLWRQEADRDLSVANRRIAILNEQQQKALHAHYAGAISLELLKKEQLRIDAEIAAAESLKASTQVTYESIEANLRRCLAFLADGHQAYLQARTTGQTADEPIRLRALLGQRGRQHRSRTDTPLRPAARPRPSHQSAADDPEPSESRGTRGPHPQKQRLDERPPRLAPRPLAAATEREGLRDRRTQASLFRPGFE